MYQSKYFSFYLFVYSLMCARECERVKVQMLHSRTALPWAGEGS